MNRRGSVILHVLVTSVVVALIAASILHVAMMRYLVTARTNAATIQKRGDEGALALIATAWSTASFPCASGTCIGSIGCASPAVAPVPGFTCTGAQTAPPGNCSCSCTANNPPSPTNSVVKIVAAGNFNNTGSCVLTIQSADFVGAAESAAGSY